MTSIRKSTFPAQIRASGVAEALLPPSQIDRLVAPDLGGNDPVLGYLTRLKLEDFFCTERVPRTAVCHLTSESHGIAKG